MKKRRVGLYGLGPDSIRLLGLLAEHPDLDFVRFFDDDSERPLERTESLDPALGARIRAHLGSDWREFLASPALDVIIDDGRLQPARERLETTPHSGPQIVSALTARLLWAHGEAARDRKSELLTVLNEIVASVELSVMGDELFARMLEIAVAVTGADGGSLMLLGPEGRELFIQVAFGVEPELWPKIRVPLGEGIAGRVAADAQPLLLSGRADRDRFQIVRERFDVESALCVPLIREGAILGVLNVHHATRSDVFTSADMAFMQELAPLDAEIIHRAQTHAKLRSQAARYEATRVVQTLLSGPAPLGERLRAICRDVADRLDDGIATIYLPDDESPGSLLTLAASSLPGGGLGSQFGISLGQGLDGSAAQTQAPILLRDDSDRLRYGALPLLVDDRLEGVLAVQVGGGSGTAPEREESLLEVADAIAEGVVRTRREARLAARTIRVSAVHETGFRMLSCQTVDSIARLSTSSLAMLLGADHVVLRLMESTSKRFKIASYFGSADDQAQPALFDLDKHAAIEVIRRRTAVLVRDLPGHPKLGRFAGPASSMIAAPIKHEGRVLGTLAVYDKVTADEFFAGRFNDEDLQVFAHFASYVERALGQLEHENTGNRVGDRSIADDARRLRTRLDEEFARARGRAGSVALTICSVENYDRLMADEDLNHAARVMEALERALGEQLREFDLLARLDDQRFGLILPDPGDEASDRVRAIARAVAERIHLDDALNDHGRIVLGFGYAINAASDRHAQALEERARRPRILMV